VKWRHGKFVCEMCGNLNFVSRQGKTKIGNNCQKVVKHMSMVGFTPGNDLVIICPPNVNISTDGCFSPLSFLSFLCWPLLTTNILNDGGFLRKGAMENLYVKCVKI
jgi:hypothetical protein